MLIHQFMSGFYPPSLLSSFVSTSSKFCVSDHLTTVICEQSLHILLGSVQFLIYRFEHLPIKVVVYSLLVCMCTYVKLIRTLLFVLWTVVTDTTLTEFTGLWDFL